MRKLLILLGVVALLGAGCGGGGSDSNKGTESKPLTKQAYQAKLAQTAKEIGAQIDQTQSDIDKMTEDDLNQFSDVVHRFADRLAQIHAPEEIADLHGRLVQAMNHLADEFPEVARKLQGNEGPGRGDRAALRHAGDPGADQARRGLQGQGLRPRSERVVARKAVSDTFGVRDEKDRGPLSRASDPDTSLD